MNSENDPAKPAEPTLPPTPITSELVDPEVETPQKTSLAFVGSTIPSCTVGEFEDSLESMDEQLMNDESPSDSLVFSAILKNFMKMEDGGYLLSFEVPEQDRGEVGRLIAAGARVFNLVAISDRSSIPSANE